VDWDLFVPEATTTAHRHVSGGSGSLVLETTNVGEKKINISFFRPVSDPTLV
jgi:hypothetical protein